MDGADVRIWLVRSSWTAGILLLLCGVFGSVWGGLTGLGDATGADFFQGMFWGSAVCFVLNGAGLVGLLTWLVLDEHQASHEDLPSN